MVIVKVANLMLRFLLELGILAALGYWGWQSSDQAIVRIGLVVGAPMLAALVWGLLIAPNAAHRLHQPWLLALEILMFGLAISALWAANRPIWAATLGGLYLVNKLAMQVWRQ